MQNETVLNVVDPQNAQTLSVIDKVKRLYASKSTTGTQVALQNVLASDEFREAVVGLFDVYGSLPSGVKGGIVSTRGLKEVLVNPTMLAGETIYAHRVLQSPIQVSFDESGEIAAGITDSDIIAPAATFGWFVRITQANSLNGLSSAKFSPAAVGGPFTYSIDMDPGGSFTSRGSAYTFVPNLTAGSDQDMSFTAADAGTTRTFTIAASAGTDYGVMINSVNNLTLEGTNANLQVWPCYLTMEDIELMIEFRNHPKGVIQALTEQYAALYGQLS